MATNGRPRQLIRGALVGAGVAAAGWWLTLHALARSRRFDFRDKVVLITGGSRGLGLVLSRQLVAAGARVVICSRDERELQRAAAQLGPSARADVVDVRAAAEVRGWIADVHRNEGRIDVLINNAGIIQVGPLPHMAPEDYEDAMATHFHGPLQAIFAARPLISRGGRIVNIASIGGEVAVPHLAPYCASKFALVGLSRGLRQELLSEGIYVTTVVPGLMRTGSPPQALFKGQHRTEYALFSISDALPLLTISAERAARRILKAARDGRAELLLTLPTKLAVALSGLCPELVAEALTLTARTLPGPGGIGNRAVKGFESTSSLSPSWLTRLSDRASCRNNELPPSGGNGSRPPDR
jgi:NAD(P)-dependent dehydrogenase (short-subunit alcohol dehydrogenase family)